jgi:hypothetical protein
MSSKFICHHCEKNFASKQMLEKHTINNVCGSQNKKEQTITLVSLDDKINSIYKLLVNNEEKEEKELIKTLKEKISFLELQLKEKDKENKELKEELNSFKKSPPKEKKSPPKEKKSKSPSHLSPPPPPSRIAEDSKEFTVRKNKFGNFEHRSGLLFNENKKVYGRQKDDGTILPLTEEDIQLCKSRSWKYKEPEPVYDEKDEEDEGYKECERKRDNEGDRLLSIELSYFNKDSNRNPHIGGISKKNIDYMKNLPVGDRKCSKDYKALNDEDKEQIEKYCKYKADKTLLYKLQADFVNYGYKGNDNEEEDEE